MTAFQKQVLLLEESRQTEEAREGTGDTPGPAGTINANHPSQGPSRKETIRYKNSGEHEARNQAEFVDTD